MTNLACDNVRWNFDALYSDLNDPQIDADVQQLTSMAREFSANFKGQLNTKLGDAIKANIAIDELSNKLFVYLFLRGQQDATDQQIKKRLSQVQEALTKEFSQHMTFFSLEIGAMAESDYQAQLKSNETVAFHKPMLDQTRKLASYNLSEEVEQALALRSPFGSREWDDLMDELEAEIEFEYAGETLKFEEIRTKFSESDSADEREILLKLIHDKLTSEKHHKFRARALNTVMGEKMISDDQRGFKHPMESRNINNQVDDATVEALHYAVVTAGAAQTQRYYKLMAKLIGKDKLKWSDFVVKPPFADKQKMPYDKALKMVDKAYRDFSPQLADVVKKATDSGWVDAPIYKGKAGGGFNLSSRVDGKTISYTFLNYLGSNRDVMTLAHELGHCAHGLLSGDAQGELMMHPPKAYAETASIFGEMLVFQHLLSDVTDKKQKLAIILNKCSDWSMSVVRQMAFCDFEKSIHEKRKKGKLSVNDFNQAWLESTEKFYGQNGEVFTYENMDNLWCYVGHFMRPFYVYAYAFGELFTQSLFAVKDNFGEDFEPMYLDMLRAGSTKNAVELMAPFGLNPNDKSFWVNGINSSIKVWLDEAESLVEELGL